MFRRLSSFVVVSSLSFIGPTFSQEPAGEREVLEEVLVEGGYDRRPLGPFLPDVEGTKINAGKKSSQIVPEEFPEINGANYRQVIARTPGLIISEESNPLISIGARGYEPGRTEYFQVLEDGIPISASMVGYPEAYYMPIFEAVDRIEVIRGGASLMYGPQPAGAINFIMKKPPLDKKLAVESLNTIGSFNSYSNFTSVGGAIDRFGYYGWYNYWKSDGFRRDNSDFSLSAYHIAFALDATGPQRLYVDFTAYNETHGFPGGLTLDDGPNAVNYYKDRNATSRFYDRMQLSRYATALIHEWDISKDTLFTFRGWWSYYMRYSRRQNGGGFGTLPTGPKAQTTYLRWDQYYTFGLEPRIRHDWQLFEKTQTLAGGLMLYNTYSPRVDKVGATPAAVDGKVLSQNLRSCWYFSAFMENRFQFGNFSIIPGLRLENIWQSVTESANVKRTQRGEPLGKEINYKFVPLFGLGLEYAFTQKITAYANASQSYRPLIFARTLPTDPNKIVNGNINENFTWNYEFGFRGDPQPWIFWDTSFFIINNSNQLGERTANNGNLTIYDNSGRSVVSGWDFAMQIDLIGLADQIFHGSSAGGGKEKSELGSWSKTYGSLNIYNALTLSTGKFTGGQNAGNTPRYLPPYLYRFGLIYDLNSRIKIAFMGNFIGSSFADDSNTASRFIPAYDVWDLTVEAKVYKDYVSIIGGVNNVFNRNYYSRIKPDGIDPAMPRNWYAGIKIEF